MTLVPLPSGRCPDCGDQLDHLAIREPAMFKHAGYGQARVSMWRWCVCGWWLLAAVRSETPRRL